MEKRPNIALVERRIRGESVHDYYARSKRIFHEQTGLTHVKIFSGDCYVTTRADEVLVTVLGSCVAVCVRDPIARVGGMNHFLLPGEEASPTIDSDAARYGVYAMERLVNALLQAGGRKDRLEIKVFGGGNVIRSSSAIGSKNVEFIRTFLLREGYQITAEDLGGELPRRIHFYPMTGKVMMRKLLRREDVLVVEEEKRALKKIKQMPSGEVDLF